MSRTVTLRFGSAILGDDLTWGQVAALYEARWRAQMDPEHASTLVADCLRIFVESWDLTNTKGHRLAFPDDIDAMHVADALTLNNAILEMVKAEAEVDIGGDGAAAPTNPTPRGRAATSNTARRVRQTGTRQRP